MRIAIPLRDQQFCAHFGRSSALMLCEVDVSNQSVDRPRIIERGATGCDSMPSWLQSLAVEVVVAGGIGANAVASLADKGIRVSAGHQAHTPQDAIDSFLQSPQGDPNYTCNHDDHHTHHCKHGSHSQDT
jgi:predicted Fe-Mo cluster-binding NifX family protein